MSEATKGERNPMWGKPSAFRGKKHSGESRRKMSEATRGVRHPNYGKTLSVETRRKLSEAHMGKKHTEETKRKMSEATRGVRHPNYGKTLSAEHRRKISEATRGVRHPMWGKTHSEETKRKLAEAHMGERNGNWQGGISFEPYGVGFNGALKLAIRERDGFVCQLCSVPENGAPHCCHHIDYDKRNNQPGNFLLLCPACHSKTNRSRAFWTHLFKAQVKLRVVNKRLADT